MLKFSILALAYLLPLAIYATVYGFDLSRDHTRWGEFGSAMAGIYAPIVALSSLSVMLAQVRSQSQFNDHELRQSYIIQSKSDIEFYAVKLCEKLSKSFNPGISLREKLCQNFQPVDPKKLKHDDIKVLANHIYSLDPGIFSMWAGIYPILHGLIKVSDDNIIFEMTLNSSIMKIISLLDYETCVALDNFHHVRTQGSINIKYQFSSILNGNDLS